MYICYVHNVHSYCAISAGRQTFTYTCIHYVLVTFKYSTVMYYYVRMYMTQCASFDACHIQYIHS